MATAGPQDRGHRGPEALFEKRDLPVAPPTVSVLIPMWNEERRIARTLRSLSTQDFDGEIEIVVADGDSTDRGVDIVRQHQQANNQHGSGRKRAAKIVLARNPSRNTAIGRNVCLGESTGEIVVNFSAHAVAPPNLIGTLVRKLEAAPDDVAAVGVANIMPEGESFSGRVIAVVNASLLGGVRSVDQNARHATDSEVPSVAFAAYRADVVERFGGFDESLWCGEDYELNYRIRKAGLKIVFTPEAVGYRFNRGSLPEFWRQMFRYGIGRSLILRKHPDSLRPAYLLPSFFCIYVVLGLLSSILEPRWLPWYGGTLALYTVLGWISSLLVSRDPALVALSPAYYFAVHFGYGAGLIRGAFGKSVW